MVIKKAVRNVCINLREFIIPEIKKIHMQGKMQPAAESRTGTITLIFQTWKNS
jgi:hypothetical protein